MGHSPKKPKVAPPAAIPEVGIETQDWEQRKARERTGYEAALMPERKFFGDNKPQKTTATGSFGEPKGQKKAVKPAQAFLNMIMRPFMGK